MGLSLTLILALVTAAVWIHGSPPGELGSDLVKLPEIEDEMDREAARSRVLQQQLNESLARTEEKNRIAAELAAGRLTLAAAADRFRPLLAAVPPSWDYLRLYGEGRNDEERLRHYVISWTRATLAGDPLKASQVACHLEQELEGAIFGFEKQAP
jgi:hypothetical protein